MSIELPPLHRVKVGDSYEIYPAPEGEYCWTANVEARERILLARIAELHKDLADCYRLTGADPDGNENWRLARDAVKEVAAMRTDLDLAEARIAELEAAITELLESEPEHCPCGDEGCELGARPWLRARAAIDAARKA